MNASPQDGPSLVLRFPVLRLRTWYRIAEILHHRGMLHPTKFRLAKFLNCQRLDLATGRVEGQYGTDRVDGGLALAARYAWQFEVGEDRYWDDFKGLKTVGLAERVVAPAPGRRAVYALCLRADAIPSDLPEDLMRELRVWDLPEAEDPDEDAAYGRLTSRQAPKVEPLVVRAETPETRQMLADLAAAPRWEHPADSKAAAIAGTIREGFKRLGEAAPDLRCTAVADPDRAAEIAARITRMMTFGVDGKPSPLYARGFSQLDGFTTTGSYGLNPSNWMEKAKTTPSAAPGKRVGQPFGDDLSAVVAGVMRRVWHSWRVQLGHGKVFLPSGTPEEVSRSITGDAWKDLHHTVAIALRRSTASEIVELLTSNLVRRNEWGEVTWEAENLGRLAGWRLWRLINDRKNSHGHGRRREVPIAESVLAWDEATAAQRDRMAKRYLLTRGQEDPPSTVEADRAERFREEARRREAARLAAEAELAAEAKRAAEAAKSAELAERWGLDRFAPAEPRRWAAREPEHVHQAQIEERRRIERPLTLSSAELTQKHVIALARAQKAARKAGLAAPVDPIEQQREEARRREAARLAAEAEQAARAVEGEG
ncbi:hypothetical protein [Streptomyces sp. NPDC059604]|uniref:hypothetical protein n=1 Tax=Streptomyces sp. NPDC059604 TaxID=3346881 RepID=UPI00369CB79E